MISTSLVISAFPGMGKTYSKKNISTLEIIDHESTPYRWIKDSNGNQIHNTEFPKNYIDTLKDIIYSEDAPDVVFVSSHSLVREALNNAKIDYYIISPYQRCKNNIITRYRERGNSEKFCKQLSENWYKYTDSINNETFPILIKFNENDFINEDLLNILLTRSREMKINTENFIKRSDKVNLENNIFWSIASKRKKFTAQEIWSYLDYIDWDILCKFNKIPNEVIMSSVYTNYLNWGYLSKNIKKYNPKIRKKISDMRDKLWINKNI